MTQSLTVTSPAAVIFGRAGPLPSAPQGESLNQRPDGGREAAEIQSRNPAYNPARAVVAPGQPLSPDNAVFAQAEQATETDPGELTEAEQEVVDDLRQRDREVRQHEQAHAAKGGPYAGAPSYDTVRGPDGASYAVGGEVKIDASPVRGDPEATIRKMEIVKRAALAPSEPSAQDRAVAAQADAQKAQAQSELRQQESDEAGGENPDSEEAGARTGFVSLQTGGLIERYREAAELAASEAQVRPSVVVA
ncbi:MAG: putative metalloprotease CJM1_0395 family protein [Rhodospirillales bacterium]